jgi:hypothetical protein
MLLKILAAAEVAGPACHEQALAAVMPPEAQRRLSRYFDEMHGALSKHEKAWWRGIFTVGELQRRYASLFQEFYDWMSHLPVPIRPVRQQLAVYSVLEPLFNGIETGWIEPGWQDFLMPDERGKSREKDLIRFLKLGIEREKILLRVRGPEQLRAVRLATASEAHVAVMRFGEDRSPEAEAARRQRLAVYREQRIPSSYILGVPEDPHARSAQRRRREAESRQAPAAAAAG